MRGDLGFVAYQTRALITPLLENRRAGLTGSSVISHSKILSGLSVSDHSHLCTRNTFEHLAYKIMPEQPIHRAAKDGDVDALRRELDDGVSPNALSGRGRTPLHYLCSRGDNPEARVDCLHVLLEAGANVNAPNVHQNTPLHLAAVRGYANVVAALLEAGADVNRGDHSNFAPYR